MVQTLQQALRIVQALPVDRGCMRCDHLDQPTGRCHVWQSVVPTEHRAAGCDKFEDTIPF
jgi:hypothetical protein